MIITKRAISRRTVLRGMGATIALPLLDAMVPALTASQNTAARAVRRLGVIYHPNGVVYENWLPTGVGSTFEFSPVLSPLAPFRDRVLVVTGLADRQAEALGDGGGDHSRASGSYLTGVHVKKSDTMVHNGISMDQIAARAFQRETQLSSLQLTVDNNNLVGSCDTGYSCAYSNTLSWLTPTLPLMSENDPRVVFERLFGASDSTDPRVRMARLRQDRSILDSVTDRVHQLQKRLGAADNTKVSDYLESLRDVERRIQKAEEQSARELPEVDRPVGIPDAFDDHVAPALRSAGAGVPVRPDARHYVHVRPRAERADVPAARHLRSASSADASSEQSGEAREVHQDSDTPRLVVHVRTWRSFDRYPTATDRCSITSCSSSAAG